MKALILAAGLGQRLRPITLTKPKPLVIVAGKPLIVHHIERLAAAGVRDIVINYSWLGEKITAALDNGEQWGVRISYSAEAEPLETGGGVFKAIPLLTNDVTDGLFIVINGDVFSDYPIDNLPSRINGLAHLVMVDNPKFKVQGDFSLVAGRVDENGEELLTFSGISVLSAGLFKDCEHGIFPLAPLLRRAMSQGNVSGEYYNGYWTDVGTISRLQTLEYYLSSGLS
ncbi:MAG: nucleotidyltransferase family protein [Candidatus Endonucleobacter bathymodioli]|uniref:Nucleotidyltransferase family protein n=1 Tax=Candidatus Endonucleibacter bathymodioli TaxID=539814 RepID=A0AA90SM65_9GAMM|nr:nucleotidyltransferase family protein [Candidatus Endonucleobacter bathymodioli]